MSGRTPWQPRFTLRTLLLIMVAACIMSAGGYYLVEAIKSGWSNQLRFVLFVVTAPLLAVFVISTTLALLNRLKPPRR